MVKLLMPLGEVMKLIEEAGYKYLRIKEMNDLMEKETTERFMVVYLRRSRLIIKSKLNSRNKIEAINTWMASQLRYRSAIIA